MTTGMAELRDKVVIVTGASAGIGEAVSRALGAQGARVVLAARRTARLDALKKEIESRGGTALAVTADITEEAARASLVMATMTAFGRIDALINNAGFGQRGPVETVPLDNIRGNFETNLFSLIGLTQLVIPVMRKQGSGRIVNIGSVAGRIARPLTSVYDATKHALEAINDGLRGELRPFGIEVVMIEPGFIRTEFLDVAQRLAEPVLDDPASPYARFMRDQHERLQHMLKYGASAAKVSDAIIKALTASRPKARYAVPAHARFFLVLRWALSDRALDWIVFRQMGLVR
ncbi:MAG: SDR family NAD(P)-dependent oxidoreductase [Acidobacteria bacterium]|nr:SDR family NAD(P)-dependent oxidoreductase [Acidobacteriota bacterium]